MNGLRPIDLARAAGISTQQVRRYESFGVIPTAERTSSGYRVYTQVHLDALLTTRTVVRGFGWQHGMQALQYLGEGRPDRAFAIADRVHLELHQSRRRTLSTIATLNAVDSVKPSPRVRAPVSIGKAAELAAVEVSALRHWEREGLVTPGRDARNGYRVYSPADVQRLQLIALLRGGGSGLPAIRDVLDGFASGDLSGAVRAAERRLVEINDASLRCAAATAGLWAHYQRRDQDQQFG